MAIRERRTQEPLEDINRTVQANIRRVLDGRTPEAYCNDKGRPLVYVTGSKKGKRVAPRALRYAIAEEQSPRLDLIAAVAAKEGIPAYQFLVSHVQPPQARRWDDFQQDEQTDAKG